MLDNGVFRKELNGYSHGTLTDAIVDLYDNATPDGKEIIVRTCRENAFYADTDSVNINEAELKYVLNDLKATMEKAKELLNKVYGCNTREV